MDSNFLSSFSMISSEKSRRILLSGALLATSLNWLSGPVHAQSAENDSKIHSSLISQATEAYKKGNYKKAQDLLSPETTTLPEQGLKLLALSYFKQKNYPQEIQTLKLLIEKAPTNANYFNTLAEAYAANKQESEAIDSFRKAIELAPDDEESYVKLLNIFMAGKNNYESRTLLETMAHRFGQKPQYLIDLCRLYYEGGFLEQAEKACMISSKKSPNDPDSLVYLAWSYRDLNEAPKAKSVLMPAAEKFSNSEFLLWAAGDFLFKEKNFAAAEKYYLKATLAQSSSSRAQLGLALSRFEQNKFDEAVPAFEKACKESVEATTALRVSARKLAQKGEIRLSSRYESTLGSCKK